MSEVSSQRNSLQEDYIGAYHACRFVWYKLRTDDELYRLPEREDCVAELVGGQYPHIPESDIRWLGNLANSSIEELLIRENER